MFTKLSLALTLLLGSALAVLAQSYVDQMTPRGKHRGSVTRRASPVNRQRPLGDSGRGNCR